jgi:hypothetical protein
VHMGTNDQKYNIIVIYKGYAKFLTPWSSSRSWICAS